MKIKNEIKMKSRYNKTLLGGFPRQSTTTGSFWLLKDFPGDIVDTPKEGTGQYKKWKELKSLMDRGKLGHKWAHEGFDKESDETINKTYAEYKERELN